MKGKRTVKTVYHRYRLVHYLTVIIIGLIIVEAVYVLCPDRHILPKTYSAEETLPQLSDESETASDSTDSLINMAAPDSMETDSASGSDDSDAQDPGSTEDTQETEAPVTVHDSYYQSANGYAWDDLCSLLVIICRSGTFEEGYSPSCAIVRVCDAFDPLLFIGSTDFSTGISDVTAYITDGDNVYELMDFEGKILVSPSEGRFYVDGAGKAYTYYPHVFTEITTSVIPDDAVPLEMTDLTNLIISVEKIPNYVLDYTEGGSVYYEE